MNHGMNGWGQRALGTLLVIIGIALGARWVYELLRPLLPFAVSGLVVVAVVVAIQRRRHW